MTRSRALTVAALCAAAVLATRVPFLASSLDDIDAVNFALAVGDFDPARHQPHPPGYAVYVLLAKLFAAAAGAEPAASARALAFLSAAAQAALPVPLFLLFRGLGVRPRIAAAATALTLLNPVVWINGVRPMSDSVGLLFAVGAQAMLLGAAATGRGLLASSALCGLAAGVRVQTLALTAPLWAYALTRPGAQPARRGSGSRPAMWRPGRRTAALAAFVVAGLAWAVPTVIESGGLSAYGLAFRGTAADAADVEPLVLTWTLNRGVRVARHVLFRPWGAEWLGIAMALLGGLGATAAWRRGVSMRLAVLAFGPYLVAHALFQQAHTQRYALPYVPLLALLAVLGMDAVARAAAPRRVDIAFLGLEAAGAAAVGAVALPGLCAYAAVDSPVYAAMREVGRIAAPRPGYVLSGHYMFSRYFALAPASVPVLRLPPRREMAALQESWLAGDDRSVLFLAEPRRTDLEAVDSRSRVFRGEWAWASAAAVLLSGERPSSARLVEMRRPLWFAGTGWGLSIEMARPDGAAEPVRTAYLRSSQDSNVMMIAGEPTDPRAAEWEGALTLAGRRLDGRSCGAPWLAAYTVPPSVLGGYLPLVFTTARAGTASGAPFALRGLAYGHAGDPMLVRGDGWHYPEATEDGRPFRWASRLARSMINVPAAGARLVVEGEVPVRHIAPPVSIEIESGGVRREVSASGPFRIELDVPPGPPREVILRSDQDFVPDAVQRNGDRRRLALRIDRFEISAR